MPNSWADLATHHAKTAAATASEPRRSSSSVRRSKSLIQGFSSHRWHSEEFARKSLQNPYIRPPRLAAEIEATERSIITPEFFAELIPLLEKHKTRLLEVGLVRAAVAQWRYRDLIQAGHLRTVESAELPVPDTIPYNELTLRSYVSDDRPMHMIRPLVTIGRIAENVADLKVLSIAALRWNYSRCSRAASDFQTSR
jgi:hypothetical protein